MGLGKDLPLWLTLVIQFINFGALVFALVYFLKKPLADFLQKRSLAVREKIDEAEKLISEAEEAKKLYEGRLAGLGAEIDSFHKSVLEEMEREKKKVLDEASALAARIRDQARLAYEQEIRETMTRVRAEIAQRTVKAAEDKVRASFGKADHDRMVEEFIDKVRSSN